MKSRITKLFLLPAGVLFLCSAVISCKNFLNAGQIKAEIEEAIEIANSKAVTMYITVDEGSGSVIPEQIVKKKKESFELKFTPQLNWKFLNWEVIDKNTGEVVPDAVKFQDPQNPETKATLLKPNASYQIHAKCVLLPAIVSVSPVNLQSTPINSPVYITFNMPMEAPDIKPSDSIFKYDDQNIAVYYGGDDMKEFFDAPFFIDSNKQILVITPKAKELKELDLLKNAPYVDIQISFGQNIIVQNNEMNLSLSPNSIQNITIRYTSDYEETPPSQIKFYATRHEISLQTAPDYLNDTDNHFNYSNRYYVSDDDNNITDAYMEMLQNRTNGTIYIYGQYYDKDSGVRAVTIKEQLVNSPDQGRSVKAEEFTHVYLFDSQNAEFVKDTSGNTYFCIKCNLESGDGAVFVKVEVSDVAGNVAKTSFVAIKKSIIDLTLDVSNAGFGMEYAYGGGPFNAESFYSQIRSISVADSSSANALTAFTKIYPVKQIPPDFLEQYELRCEYVDKNGHLRNEKMTHKSSYHYSGHQWDYYLDVAKVSGLEFKIIFNDDMGNTAEKSFKLPESNDFLYYKEKNNYNNNYENVYFVSKNPEYNIRTGLLLRNLSDGTKFADEDGSSICNNATGYSYLAEAWLPVVSYQIVPRFIDKDSNKRFYLEVSDTIFTFGISEGDLDDVQLKLNTEQKPVINFEKSNEKIDDIWEALKVTVAIDDNSWKNDKYDLILMKDPDSQQYFFEKGQTTCSFLMRTMDLMSGDPISPVMIYGYKGDKGTQGTECQIPSIESAADKYTYDNVLPHVNDAVRKDWRTFTISFTDSESGPDTGVFKIVGFDKEYIANEQNNYTVDIPIANVKRKAEIDSSENESMDYYFSVECFAKDKAENETYIKSYDIDINYLPPISKMSGGSPAWTFESVLYDEEIEMFKPYFYVESLDYDSTQKKYVWSNYNYVYANDGQIMINDEDDENYGKWYYKHTINSFALPQNTFLRIYCYLFGECSFPINYYYGDKSYEKGDILQTHTDKSVLISSELPVCVYTVATTAPYSECKDWTVDQWDFYNLFLGEDLLDFATYPRPFLQYDIPYDEIDKGCSYVVVARFTSGKIALSPVYQK